MNMSLVSFVSNNYVKEAKREEHEAYRLFIQHSNKINLKTETKRRQENYK